MMTAPDAPATLSGLLATALTGLTAAGSDSPRADAEALLAHVLARPRSFLRAWPEAPVAPEAAARFLTLLERRMHGEPVAYLSGRRGFWTLELEVTPATLIPRPETELLVELALARLPDGRDLRVADLGTGSGAIALALAAERPRIEVTATDASPAALAIAQANAARLGLGNLRFAAGDWCAALEGRYALIASNPPYLADDDPHLGRGDLRFEPRRALAAGADGLADLRRIVDQAAAHLEADGWLLLEHGHDQGEAVPALLAAAGYRAVACVPDLGGRPRVSLAQAPA